MYMYLWPYGLQKLGTNSLHLIHTAEGKDKKEVKCNVIFGIKEWLQRIKTFTSHNLQLDGLCTKQTPGLFLDMKYQSCFNLRFLHFPFLYGQNKTMHILIVVKRCACEFRPVQLVSPHIHA